MTTPDSAFKRIVDSYDRSLQLVFDAHHRNDWEDYWHTVRDHLGWMYTWEQAVVQRDGQQFYQMREVDPDGQTEAALVWVRGLVVHSQAEVTSTALIQVRQWRATAKGLKPITQWIRNEAGELVEVRTHQPMTVWPDRTLLPPPSRNTRARGRDVYYDQHVAGKLASQPLLAAHRFVMTLS